MVEYAAEGIFAVWGLHGQFYGFGDGRTQTALIVGVFGKNFTSGFGTHTGRSDDLCAERLHDRPPVRFLVVADFDHIDGQFESESLGGKREGRSPLTGSGLGCNIGYALFFTEVGLCDGRVEFMGSYRTDALIFEVNMGWSIEIFFQSIGTHQRGRTPYFVHVAYLFGYFDPRIGLIHFLMRQFFGEERIEIFLFHRFMCLRIQRWQGFGFHIGDDIVPCRRNIFFL